MGRATKDLGRATKDFAGLHGFFWPSEFDHPQLGCCACGRAPITLIFANVVSRILVIRCIFFAATCFICVTQHLSRSLLIPLRRRLGGDRDRLSKTQPSRHLSTRYYQVANSNYAVTNLHIKWL